MIKAAIPLDEKERLQKLQDYQILDTAPETLFDDIVALASHICGTRISLVSLVDENRQWFKARIGIDATETPRDLAFCAHAILGHSVMVVEDATQDERFHDNPVVTSGLVRFYAGAPLVTHDGFRLGTLCVVEPEARKITAEQTRLLEALARQVVSQLELRSMNRRLVSSEVKLLESSRLASVGLLAGGIAHEINNPLAVICGTTEQLKEAVERGDAPKERLLRQTDRIHSTALRIASIVKSMKLLASSDDRQSYKPTEVDSAVQHVLNFTEEYLRIRQVTLTREVEPGLHFHGCETQVAQVISNLVNNSADAIEKRSERWIRLQARSAGEYVEIAVTDSGEGIAPDLRAKIFMPFFSTKPVNKGTGLGLSIAMNIVSKHGGQLFVDEDSQNTRLVFRVPKAGASVSAA